MKKFLAVIVVLLFVCANSYAQSVVQSGSYFYSKDSPNYTLMQIKARDLLNTKLLSTNLFDKKPKVIIMPSLMDAERATQVRYNIRATGISRDGFVLLAEVWGDTQLNSIGGFWLAHTEE